MKILKEQQDLEQRLKSCEMKLIRGAELNKQEILEKSRIAQ